MSLVKSHQFKPNPHMPRWCHVCELAESDYPHVAKIPDEVQPAQAAQPVEAGLKPHDIPHAYKGVPKGRCEVCDALYMHSCHKVPVPVVGPTAAVPPVAVAAPLPVAPVQEEVRHKRNLVVIPQDLIERIDDYWHKERFRSRSAALRSLIEKGLGR